MRDFIFLKTHAGLFKIDDNPFTTVNNTRGFILVASVNGKFVGSWVFYNTRFIRLKRKLFQILHHAKLIFISFDWINRVN